MQFSGSHMSGSSIPSTSWETQSQHIQDTAGSPGTPLSMQMNLNSMPAGYSASSPMASPFSNLNEPECVNMRDLQRPDAHLMMPMDYGDFSRGSSYAGGQAVMHQEDNGYRGMTAPGGEDYGHYSYSYPQERSQEIGSDYGSASNEYLDEHDQSSQNYPSPHDSSKPYRQHVQEWNFAGDEKKFSCSMCTQKNRKYFKRRADVMRHIKTVHFPQEHRFDCKIEDCPRKGARGYTRKDHYDDHLRDTHHLKIPKHSKGSEKNSPGDKIASSSMRR